MSSNDNCVKCNQSITSVSHLHGAFCKNCFQVFVIHKFRAAIGRTKLITNGEDVLVACSGGDNSSALLHLIQHGKSESAHRKLRFIPQVLYVDEYGALEVSSEDRMAKRAEILQVLIAAGFPVYVSSLEQALNQKRSETTARSVFVKAITSNIPLPPNVETSELKSILSRISSLTSLEDFIKQLRCQLIVTIATELGISKVLTAENCTKLAIQVLSCVAQGRGSQISQSTGFSDSRNNVMFIRPLRDLSSSDLAAYNKLFDVPSTVNPIVIKKTSSLSIEHLTEMFVLSLLKDFPSTVNNIKRTSEKLEQADLRLPKCYICKSPLDIQMESSSAQSALKFSYSLSHSQSSYTRNIYAKFDQVPSSKS
ncbi:cytoplasmic tRNA 2-thiolation protein 2-B-like isoform X3 [Biomphalaria glabrata]|uniref:Cytoplasmic tRNA 2-thiolation protein 2 n=1 Tax=Biomphalaria glabrata TaxID=6526 RepID=A0A9W3AZQ4_BIOGL|nr:cytoplasmic tRNA 2-thiolation protein 2-B-like isoform X3 [Biomphalaria glabrata]